MGSITRSMILEDANTAASLISAAVLRCIHTTSSILRYRIWLKMKHGCGVAIITLSPLQSGSTGLSVRYCTVERLGMAPYDTQACITAITHAPTLTHSLSSWIIGGLNHGPQQPLPICTIVITADLHSSFLPQHSTIAAPAALRSTHVDPSPLPHVPNAHHPISHHRHLADLLTLPLPNPTAIRRDNNKR
jgi:hypothetical protein